jgi:WD40 repeat protein
LIILALTVTSVFGFFYSQNQKNKAEQMALLANEESREAQKQREVAQQQSELAHRQEEISKQQALIATQESERANEARADAVNQQKNAEYQKIIAEQQKQAAEQAKLLADRSAEEALQSKEIAENERQKAYTLRILGLVRELAIKSTYMLDKEPKALLALQAYNFNSVYGGKAFNSDLYRALLLARQKYSSADNNTIRAHKLAVSGMLPFRDQIISCSHDGKIILTGLGDNHKEQILESTNSAFETIALHPDNSKVVLGTQSGFITIYNLVARKFTFEKRIFNDESIKVLTTSDAIYAIGSNGSFQMMDWSGNEITSSSFQKQIVDAATNPSTGEVWIVTDKNEILVKKEGSVIQRFTIDQQNAVKAIEFDRTGKLAAVGFDNGTIGLLDPSSLKLSRLLSGHVSAITDLTVSEDGNYLASASYDRSVRLWKLDQLQDQPILLPDHDSWVSSVAFDKKGYIVVGTYNGTQLFYPLESSSLVNGLCGRIGRNLTLPEWQEYIGSDIQYEQTCKP